MIILQPWKGLCFQGFPELDYSAFYKEKHSPTNSNPSPAASKRSETNGFQTSFLVSDPLFDPLTVLGLLIDSAPHIGFHAVCAVLFHFFRDMAIYVVPRSLLGTARKAAPPNGGAALRQLVKKVRTDFFDKLRQNRKIKNSILFCDFGRCGG